jgi:hypothetical protein
MKGKTGDAHREWTERYAGAYDCRGLEREPVDRNGGRTPIARSGLTLHDEAEGLTDSRITANSRIRGGCAS